MSSVTHNARSTGRVEPSRPIAANYSSSNLTIGAGVAIFHLATERVIVVQHTRDRYWFLPKGRRNASEDTGRAAEREGFEESGYRNRLLPLPIEHRQPDDDGGHQDFVIEPVWTQLLPLTSRVQYLLHWYVAETVPREVEMSYADSGTEIYRQPDPFPRIGSLRARIAEDVSALEDGTKQIYEPIRHEGTGVDEDELLYKAHLMPVEEACRKLRGTVQEDVVHRGLEYIQRRIQMEDAAKDSTASGAM
ncbi:Putative NUDIX hydrolase domain-containing protein [Septoria linicola]|uniref:NUDIX hydrolase domain-containing protein n=1 Tax=Septoria linicola TaxID=215465 RepID=A0A9Q9ED07_9PEZI|nr:putative NUDIX hydrolase domain-containing protein [Septoria linicola]USW47266.1 Putative NUDIX hydrolase domain-containing protein [Septoria linicola]